MNKKIIFYIVLIIIILVIAFFSQQSYSQNIIKDIFSYINKYAGASLLAGFDLNKSDTDDNANANSSEKTATTSELTGSAYSSTNEIISPSVNQSFADRAKITISDISEKVTEGLKSGGEAITNNVNNVKENISTAEKNIENYISGIKDAVQGKTNTTCTPSN